MKLTRYDFDPHHRLSNREAVLQALRARGDEGVHSHELRVGAFTGNPSERVRELKRAGYAIEVKREGRGRQPGIRIFLRGEPSKKLPRVAENTPTQAGSDVPLTPGCSEPALSLFEMPAERPRNPLRDAEAA